MPEKTKTRRRGPLSNRFFWPAFVVLTIAFYFFGLSIPLVGPDEPRYAQIAREMYERGDWITPTLGGFPWFEKPALLYWLEIASYSVFGINEFAARFGPALFGLSTIIALWLIARFSDSENRSDAGDFANWTSLISASTLGLIVFSRGASFDIVVTFPITASLAGFYINVKAQSSTTRALAMFSFYFFTGLALLAKGLIGVVFPFGIAALYLLLSRRWPSKNFMSSLVWGLPLILAIAAIWYVPVYLRNGYRFFDEFFVQHHFQRFLSNKYQHPQPFYFFFWVLPLMTIPWLPFFFAAIWKQVRKMARPGNTNLLDTNADTNSLMILSFAWMLLPLGFFSFSGSKLPGYILPSVPAAILITADYIFSFVRRGGVREILIKTTALVTYIVVLFALLFVVPGFARRETVKGLIATANERGFSDLQVACFITVSHNAEFYAAGRLIRDADGKQHRFVGPPELFEFIDSHGGQSLLVLSPVEHIHAISNSERLSEQVLDENGELAILLVSERSTSTGPPKPVH